MFVRQDSVMILARLAATAAALICVSLYFGLASVGHVTAGEAGSRAPCLVSEGNDRATCRAGATYDALAKDVSLSHRVPKSWLTDADSGPTDVAQLF